MDRLERILSRPVAKPYRTKGLDLKDQIFLNKDGHLDFAPDDVENPKNWSVKRKWYITVVSVLLVVNATFASSSPSGCLPSIAKELHVAPNPTAGLVVTLFLLGYVFGPLLWAPLSEFFGRRWVFYFTFLLYLAFNFLCAFAPNFGALLVGRFLTGTFASSTLSNAPGVLADIWGPVERGNAMALFSMMTFIGPGLGPVVSGFLQLTEDWRWSFYVLLWLAAGTLPFMFTIPETLPSQVLLNKAKRIRRAKIPGYENVIAPVEATDRSLKGIFMVALTRPWQILFDPISLFCAIYLSVVYTLLYMLFSIYPFVFQTKRGWNAGVGELPLIGTVVGACCGGAYVFYVSAQDKKKILAGQPRRPEDRLIIAMVGGIIFPISMFGLAWSGNYNSVHWIVPTIFGAILASSILLVFVAYLNYITDSYLMYAASALAANTICRSAAGSAAPLFTEYMFSALGVGGAGSLIAGVACLLAPIPFVFYRYGEPIRKRSKFAPTEPASEGDSEEEKPKDDDDANKTHQARNGSTSGESTDREELALDEEQGVPAPADLEEQIAKERREAVPHQHGTQDGDRFIDASGLEKAER